MSTATAPAPTSLDDARDQAAQIAGEPAAATPPAADVKPRRARPAGKTRKRAPRKPAADRAPRTPPAPSRASLKAQIEEAITGVGFVVSVVNLNDGQLIMQGAKRQAAALDALAKENPAVRDALTRMLKTSVYAQLAMAFAPTLLGIAGNHGLVPPIVGQLAGMATTAPGGGSAPVPGPGDPLAGVDLTDVDPADAAALIAMFAGAPNAPEGGDGAPRGVVTGIDPVG